MILRAALVSVFAALLALPLLGQRLIVTGDEARFAVLAQDMLTRSTWVDARVRDERATPPLYPWAIKVLSIPPGRVTETTAQLPVVLAAVASVFFTTLLGQQLFSPPAGIAAGLITATSYGFFAHSQALLPDMLAVALGMAALYAFWASLRDPPNLRALAVFYALVAGGVATRGPMGLLPVAVVVVWLLTGEGVRGLHRLGSRAGGLAFVAVTAGWLVPCLLAGRGSMALGVLGDEWRAWSVGLPQPLPMLTVLLDGAKGLIPWTTLLLLPLLAVTRRWGDAPFRFAFLAWILPLVAALLSQHHRARSLLPTYPAAALLIAWWCDRHGAEPSRAVTLVSAMTGAGVLVALAVVALPWLDPINRDLAEPFWWTAILIVAGGVVLGGYACWALLRRRPTALVAGVAVLMAGFLAGGVRVHTHWVNRSQDFPGLAALIERYAQGRPVGITGGRFLSIDFYLGRALTPVPTVAAFDAWVTRPERPLVVITDRDWLRYRHEVRSNVEVLDTMRIRTHLMFLVWLAEPGTPRIEGSRAGRELPQPAP